MKNARTSSHASTSVECPDGAHRWVVVRDYHGRDYFSVTKLDVQAGGVRVTADMFPDSDEIVHVHGEVLACRDCAAERDDVTVVDYQ